MSATVGTAALDAWREKAKKAEWELAELRAALAKEKERAGKADAAFIDGARIAEGIADERNALCATLAEREAQLAGTKEDLETYQKLCTDRWEMIGVHLEERDEARAALREREVQLAKTQKMLADVETIPLSEWASELAAARENVAGTAALLREREAEIERLEIRNRVDGNEILSLRSEVREARAALATARAEALEEAAKVADKHARDAMDLVENADSSAAMAALDCAGEWLSDTATAIRALASQEGGET